VGTFAEPVYVTGPSGDTKRLFVVEKGGRIKLLLKGKKLARPFLNIANKVSSGGEQGLLSMAFAPNYSSSRKFYVNYTDKSGDTRVVEYRAAKKGRYALKKSARLVIKIPQPADNHNGGQLQFGSDGYLYIGMGDGGGAGDPDNNAQNLRSLLGKMLRIKPVATNGRGYSVPADNPFVNKSGARAEIYSYGLRNPWRFSFDRLNGALVIADVGQSEWEEVDYAAVGAASGANYGWRAREGDHPYGPGTAPNAVPPVLEMSHSDGWCSITGGYVVRDKSLPSLNGKYLFGDFCKSEIYSAKLAPGSATGIGPTGLNASQLVSFGQDGSGRIYTVSLTGKVSRVVG